MSYLFDQSEAACGSGGWRRNRQPTTRSGAGKRHNSLSVSLVVEGAALQVSDEGEFGVFPAESELPGCLKVGVALKEGGASYIHTCRISAI